MADKGKRTIATVMDFLKETFNTYSALDGEKGLMSKKEFANLLRTQEGIVSKK